MGGPALRTPNGVRDALPVRPVRYDLRTSRPPPPGPGRSQRIPTAAGIGRAACRSQRPGRQARS